MSETRRVRRGEGYGACDAADREKVICPLAKFAMKVFIPKRTKMGENDSEAKTGSGTAFIEAAKTGQSRKGEFVICAVWITMSRSVTLYSK